jgi:hypothetical protein
MVEIEEVKKHNKENDCWLIIDGKVYNVTSFLDDHPGGKNVLLGYGGKDCSQIFHTLHKSNILEKYGKELLVGNLGSDKKEVVVKSKEETFGEMIPFGDPYYNSLKNRYWYQGFKSPYYKKTHEDFRKKVRDFVEKEIKPYLSEWEQKEEYPRELHTKAYKAGLLAATW